jgi:hypothetical protein
VMCVAISHTENRVAMTDSRNAFAMSPLSSLDHVNREFVARYGPALHPYPKRGGTVL